MVNNKLLVLFGLLIFCSKSLIGQVSDNDGNTYSTVKIGNQEWMAENLKTTKYKDGSTIYYPGTDYDGWQNNTTGAYAWYNNDAATYKNAYGALYNWHAVNNAAGLCPIGWHLPSRLEFDELASVLGGTSIAGGKMKQIGTTYWLTPNEGATNESGFTGRGHGYRATGSTFNDLKKYGEFWTTNEEDANTAWAYILDYNYPTLASINEWKENGFGVRCVKDNLTTGLVAFYPFSGNTNDESGNANNGVNHGATPTTDRFNNENSAYSFDGTDDYISVATTLVPPGGNEYTISLWFNLNAISDSEVHNFISQWTSANAGNSFYLELKNQNMSFSDSWFYFYVGGFITNHWYNLVGVSTTTNAYIYLNGIKILEKGSPLTYTGVCNATIGVMGEQLVNFVNGKIDDIRIYNRVLSDEDILQIFHEGGWVDVLPGEYATDGNTMLLMHINELSGTDVADVSSNANNGTAIGTIIVEGRFGKARSFTTSDNIIIPASSSIFLGNSDFTIEMWVKSAPITGENNMLISKGGGEGSPEYKIFLLGNAGENNGRVIFTLSDGVSVSNTTSIKRVDDDQWHHIAAVRTGDNRDPIKIYIDGVLDAANPSPGLLGVGTNAYLNIGNGLVSGIIDEVRISNSIRAPQEFDLQLPPKNLTSSITGNGVTLNWENGGGYVDVQYYSIYRGTDSTNLTFINNTTATTFTDYVDLGGSYFYRVSAVDITFFESQQSYADSVFYNGLVAYFPFSGWVDGGTANGATLTSDRFFKDHRAYFFDGFDDDISINPIDLSASQQATFTAWIKPNAVDGMFEIIRQEGSPDFLLSFQGGSILSFGLHAGGVYNELDVTINPSAFLDDRWHHVAAVYDGNKMMLYCDGVLIGENAQTGYILFSSGANTRIGSYSGTNEFFYGKIDEVLIYNRALSETEIKNLYHENGYMQTTDVDGITYKTVIIGTQEWMAENLKTTRYANGDNIGEVTDAGAWTGLTTGAYCWWNNDFTTYKEVCGALYNWHVTNDNRGICPTGWHVPIDAEWFTLENFVDPTINDPNASGWRGTDGGTKLKATSGWASGGNGTDNFGFKAMPGGSRDGWGIFQAIETDGHWWSLSENLSTHVWIRDMLYSHTNLSRQNVIKNNGISIRCLKNVFSSALVAYYPLNFNANDVSGNGFNGTSSNTTLTTDRFNNGNHAFQFQSAQSSYVQVPIYDVSYSNKVSVQAWVKCDEFPTDGSFSQIFRNNVFFVAFQPYGQGFRFNVDTDAGGYALDVTISPSDYIGSWHLITAVYDGTTQKVYSDGELLGEASLSGSFVYSDWGYPSIGSFNGESEFFNGTIDEVSIFNRALSQDEIKRYYANYHPPKNFTAEAVQTGQNKLTWSSENIANYTKFRIYRNGNYYDEVNVTLATDTVYYDNGAVPNSIYQYRISSVDLLGYESYQTDPIEVFSAGNEVMFSEISAGLVGLASESDGKWGDYNNDGLLDILLAGKDGSGNNISWIYKNNGNNSFSYQSGIPLTGVNSGSVDWADYNNDGFLDIIITGYLDNSEFSRIYRNNGNETFTEMSEINIVPVRVGSVKWGDYNNDGKKDIIITGDDAPDEFSYTGINTRIYRNNGNDTFSDQTSIALDKVYSSSVAWGDYDNDNDLDILLTGENPANGPISKIYKNVGNNVFEDQTSIQLTGVNESSASWIDYNNDGNLDILLAGFNGSSGFSKIYKNNGDNAFSPQDDILLAGLTNSSVHTGDYDNDGDIDILISGHNGSNHVTRIFRNDGSNVFTERTEISLANTSQGNVSWGDYDNDGDLDILLTGQSDAGPVSMVYRNESALANVPPSTPQNLNSTVIGSNVTLNWNPATDNETPQQSLTYNVRVGSNPGTFDIASPHALSNGKLTTPAMGNAQLGTSFLLKNLAPGTYYWSVQSVDNGYLGSTGSEEKSFTVLPFDEAFNFYAVNESSSAWGDYDNDGDLDIIITGSFSTCLYRNDGNSQFTQLEGNGFPMVREGSTAWGDYDRDGDLDLLITGDFGGGKVSRIYRNDGSDVFVDIGAPFIGLSQSSAEWGDLDSDGDLDILLTGIDANDITKALIYRNNGDGSFSSISMHSIESVRLGRTKFADYDYDGDLDILLIGWKQNSSPITRIYKNQGNFSFTAMEEFGLMNIHHGSVDWGDYDCDGDLDIIICGHTGSVGFTRIYRNEGTYFSEQPQISIDAFTYSNVQFGDYDNDGWLDVMITGLYENLTELITKIYRNKADNTFEWQSSISLPGTYRGSAEWGDCDGDGDLDIVLTGESSSGSIAKIFRNNVVKKNSPPTAPTSLNYSQDIRQINLWWTEPSEQETPWVSLTYNVRIGTSPGASDIVSPHSLTNGKLTVPSRGNATSTRTFKVKNLTPGTYYWSVQAVDNGFAGGPWAQEQSFTMNEVAPFSVSSASLIGVVNGTSSWGDYDNDGDLDILLDGNAGTFVTKVYRNDGNETFTDLNLSLQGVANGSSSWGDYDNDGDLDILLTGWFEDVYHSYVSKIYRNDGGSFNDSGIEIVALGHSYAAWGDYNNDGLLDIIISGELVEEGLATKIYKNKGDNSFEEQTDILLAGMNVCSLDWGDYDNDGDLDVVLCGWYGTEGLTTLYRNDGDNVFTVQAEINIIPLFNSSVDWGDYDGDGFLDIVLTGRDDTANPLSVIYRNNTSGNFIEQTSIDLIDIEYGGTSWGDYDNDGDLDLLILPKIYSNNGDGSFSLVDITLNGSNSCSWGDYDGDGDLDIVYVGPGSGIYRNESLVANTPPSKPENLWTSQNEDQVILYWNASTDFETNAGTLTYNVRVGTSPGGRDIVSPHSLNSGKLTTQEMGNAQLGTTYNLNNLAPGTYYWSVQAVDNGYAASSWADEQSFTVEEKFTEINAGLIGVSFGSVKWGDYDADGDLDALITGKDANENPITRIYKNSGDGTFTQSSSTSVINVKDGSGDWGDFNNDGFLDILLFGNDGTNLVTKIYGNDGNDQFTELTDLPLLPVSAGAAAWGDYDNDGNQDILLTGNPGSGIVTKIYRNDGNGSFTEQNDIAITGIWDSSVHWGDYDNDGDLDILMNGNNGNYVTKIYRNDGNNVFTERTSGLQFTGVDSGDSNWGDYDGDGDLDILLTGYSGSGGITKVYRNDGNEAFSELEELSLPGTYWSSSIWGDYDNDGDLDILITGNDINPSRIFRNEGNDRFVESKCYSIVGVWGSSVEWGDYDNDNDLDILLTGQSGSGPILKIYRNNTSVANSHPTTPSASTSVVGVSNVTFLWNPSTDAQTPSSALSYNVRIGSNPGGCDIVCPHSLDNGKLTIPAMGNAQLDTSFFVKNLPPGTYYWSVQAVDNGYMGGGWDYEQSFTVVEQFTEIDVGLVNVTYGSSMFGDYDNDEYLDLIITGIGDGSSKYSKVYHNNGDNTFTEHSISIPGVDASSVQWGDYDNDGDLDILLTGADESENGITKVYRNNGDSSFTEISVSLTGTTSGSLAWGDYDNDGDLDILLTGWSEAKIYRNDGNNNFIVQTSISLYGIEWSSVAWGDYDNDNFLDILISGSNNSQGLATKIYRNNQNSNFIEQTQFNFEDIYQGSATWADYNNDGYLDVLLAGNNGSNPVSRIYKNNGDNTFTEQSSIVLDAVYRSSASWGDYNNDGNIDLLLSGDNGLAAVSQIFMNNGNGNLVPQKNITLPQIIWSSTCWGDIDNDGDLDILMSGQGETGYISKILVNNLNIPNTPPLIPSNLAVKFDSYDVTLSWDAATDSETPSSALTYNVRVGSISGGWDIVSPHSLENGKLTVPAMGNAQLETSFILKNLPEGNYFWSVQAIDNGYLGGEWSDENCFVITSNTISGIQNVCKNQNYVEYSVDEESGVSYTWSVSNGTIIDGQGTSRVFVAWGESSGNESVTLARTYSEGCSRTDDFSVDVNFSSSTIPAVIKKGRINILICTAANMAHYEWFRNGTSVVGANKQYYIARSSLGSYQVEITNSSFCKGRSNIVQVTSSVQAQTPLVIYPNPGSGQFTFDMECDEIGSAEITVVDAYGIICKKISTFKSESHVSQRYNLSDLKTGFYTVVLKINGEVVDSQKLVIM